jgi:hypothetical protein
VPKNQINSIGRMELCPLFVKNGKSKANKKQGFKANEKLLKLVDL